MASIQKRDNGRWRARYRDESGKEHARHFDRKVDAQGWLDRETSKLVTGTWVDPRSGRLTFAQWWEQWSQLQVWARNTRLAADYSVASVTFGDVPMRQITEAHVQAWVKARTSPVDGSRPIQASTMRTRLNFVRMAFAAAVRQRVIPFDPTRDVKVPRARRAEVAMVIPTPEQVASVLDGAAVHFRPFVAVCAFAGLRLGEAAGLQLGDVDFLRRTITVARQVQGQTLATTEVVPPKAGSERVVYVPEALVELLAAHVKEIGVRGEEQWLFTNGGDLWHRNSAGKAFRRARDAAGLSPEVTLHTCRHFFASALIADGCDVVTVQRALGHSSPSITLNTYAHLWSTAEDRTRSAASRLMESVLGAPADSVRTTGTNHAVDLRGLH